MRIRFVLGFLGWLLFSILPLFGDGHTTRPGFYFGLGAAATFADATTETSHVRIGDDLGAGGSRFYESYWSFEPGVSFSGAAGYDFGDVRVEGEFSYTVNSIGQWAWEARDAGGNVTNRTFIERRLDAFGMMANGWYDFDTGTPISPYFGGGMGAVYLAAIETEWAESLGVVDIGEYDFLEAAGVGIGIQAGAGFGIDLLDFMQLRLGYRLTATLAANLVEDRDFGSDTYPRTHYLPYLLDHRIELRLSHQS